MPITIPYFIVTIIAGLLAWFYQKKVQVDIIEGRKAQKGKFIFLLLILLLAFFAAFRHIQADGIDEYAYRNRFNHFYGMTFSSVMDAYTAGYEPVFQWIVWISTKLFHTDQGVLILTGLLITIGYLVSIRKYCIDNFAFAVVLFCVTGSYFSSFNGIQQTASVVIFVLLFDRFYEHKFLKAVIITALCFLTHNAAVFIIAYYFMLKIDFGTKKMYIVDIIFVLALYLVYKNLPNLNLGETLSMMTGYTVRNHGINIFTLLIEMVPAGIAIVLGPKIDQNDKCTLAMGHMAIVNALIYLLCIMDTYIARIAMFSSFFAMLFIVRSLRYIEDKSTVTLIKVLSVVLYSIVFILRNSNALYYFQFA